MFFRNTGLAVGAILLIVAFGASTAGAARRDRTPPTTPTNLRITATTDTTISLAWNASTDNSGNFSYRVTESSGFNTYTVAVPQTRTTLTFTRLWPEQTYRYTVYAEDAAGNRSGNSNTVSHTVPADVTPDAGAAADRDPLQAGAGRFLMDAVGRQRQPGPVHALRQRNPTSRTIQL
jgi:hypothetical protein